MLKIKDSVDLKELEKFGFVESINNLEKYVKNYGRDYTEGRVIGKLMQNKSYVVVCTDLTISFEGYIELDGYFEDFYNDTLYDLIKADLIEKVEE